MHGKKIIIVGGGFGGVRAALALAKERISGAEITLITDRPNFEYTPALYRIVAGGQTENVAVPLPEIFKGTAVKVTVDAVEKLDLFARDIKCRSGATHSFDFCVLALGAETNYFNIPGLKEWSFGFKTIEEAMRLNAHLKNTFRACTVGTQEEKECGAHIVVVGAGATGVELAAELCGYTKALAKQYGVEEAMVKIDLVEALPRVLPLMPEEISARVSDRLKELGVNLMLGHKIMKQEAEKIHMENMMMTAKTLVWATGAKPNHLCAETEGLECGKNGKITVNEFLEAKGTHNVFVIGDAANTPFTGYAQTADSDGAYVAKVIAARISGKIPPPYSPEKPASVVPVGVGWAAALVGDARFYGRIGWWLRRVADLRYFLTIVSLRRALRLF